MSQYAAPDDVDAYLRPVMVKDLRLQLRARGLTPAGSRESLVDRLKEHMLQTGDYTFKNPDGSVDQVQTASVMKTLDPVMAEEKNNYQRPEGQNVGNFLTDRNTSRVLAPPGGETQVSLGYTDTPAPKAKAPAQTVAQQPSPQQQPQQGQPARRGQNTPAGQGEPVNNYSRPGGMQNVGNFLTDRNTSRVLAPPGGNSSITFG